MSGYRRIVKARTRLEIEREAGQVRAALGLKPTDAVDMSRVVDLGLAALIKGFEMRVAEDKDLGRAEAVTDLSKPVITFAAKTYDALCRGDRRARMTAAHEIGHLMMHTAQPVGLAYMRANDARVDPERQADLFAAAFLMPEAAFRRMVSIEMAMKVFGVSRDAATCRARKLRMAWLVHRQAPPRTYKKGMKPIGRTP